TGPNRGGKTTYTRAVGQAQILFQAGLHVPASQARLSPADAIYTHFPRLEEEQLGQGRLDEEAKRLARVFKDATRYSLILLNEVLAGTSAIEALGIAFDAMRGLRLLGARAIYTTHLHELAARADEINAGTPGDALVGSLVAQVEEETSAAQSHHARTFRIVAGPPRGSSYASEIAEQHGISYPQLEELLQEREQVANPN
ncbi:MAG: DNA mismatch repair protein MutS, partial [Chloroflexota bacterium]|nr:DNA mismatch repair protein MutS [Chloroflexota bacterium]